MKVEIWSDMVCPFCYIGKRRFEAALEQFPQRADVEVIYKSFELDPNAMRDPGKNMHALLAEKYGMSMEQAKAANENVSNQAKSVGLTYRFDTMIPTNSFDAHRLTHLAAKHGKMTEMTEAVLQAYFTDSKHIADAKTLTDLAVGIGLDKAEVTQALSSDAFGGEVRSDEQEAHQLGINGVPFFVLNRKYAVSGAQPTEVFLQALKQAWQD